MTDTSSSEPVRIGPEDLDLSAVGRVASLVEIRHIRLAWSHSQLRIEPEDAPSNWTDYALIGFDAHASPAPAGLLRARTMHFAHFNRAWMEAEEPPSPSDDPENPDEIELAISFTLDYEPLDEVDEEDFRHFAFYNSTFNAWPYWRAFAQQTSQSMGIPALTIPVYRVQSLSRS